MRMKAGDVVRHRGVVLAAAVLAFGGVCTGCSGASGTLPVTSADTTAPDTGTSSPSGNSEPTANAADVALADAGADATLDATLADAGDASVDAAPEAAPPSLCDGILVCDDFESTAVDAAPNPALWTLGAPDCFGPPGGRGTAAVDDTVAHSGHHSVKVVNDFGDGGPPQYCDHAFFLNDSAFAVAGPEQVYTRFYMTLGEDAGVNHVTFSTMRDSTENGQLRLGFDDGVFVWNRTSGNAFLPELQSGTPAAGSDPIDIMESMAPPTGWFCVEFHIDETAGTIDTWINGTEVAGLVYNGTPVTNISADWAAGPSPPLLTDLGFGWEAYAGTPMILWFDDVAIDTKRIGCIPQDQ